MTNPGEIETWIMDPGTPELQDVFKGYVADFEAANPGTKVNLQFVPWAQAHDKFTTAIAGGAGPDVAEMGTTWTPEAVQAIEFYTNLYKQGYAPKAAITWEEPDARTAFINGKIAMMWAGPWDYDAIVTEKPGLEGKVGVTLVPAGPSGDRSAFAGGSHLVAFKESDNPELASAFVDFLLEPEQVNTFTGRIGFLPGTVSGIEASGMLEDEVKAPFAEQLKDYSQVYPPSPKWGALEGQNIFDGAIQAVMKGDETPEQAMQEVSQKMDEELGG